MPNTHAYKDNAGIYYLSHQWDAGKGSAIVTARGLSDLVEAAEALKAEGRFTGPLGIPVSAVPDYIDFSKFSVDKNLLRPVSEIELKQIQGALGLKPLNLL